MHEKSDKYRFFQTAYTRELSVSRVLQQQSSRLTALRTVSFLLMIFSFAAGYDGHIIGSILGVLFLITFAALVHRHSRLKERIRLQDSLLTVIQSFLCRFDGRWKDFAADGADMLRKECPQQSDLSVFGHASLYQYLSCAHTLRGCRRLAEALTAVPPGRSKILARQQAVAELIKKPQFCLSLEARGRLLPEHHDTTKLLEELETQPAGNSRISGGSSAIRFFPLIVLLGLILAGVGQLSWTAAGLLTAFQFLLAMAFHRQNQKILAPLASLTHELHQYEVLFREIEQADFSSTTLCALQQRLQDGGASDCLHKLAALTDRVAMGRNLFFFVLANTLFLWDCHQAAAFSRWRESAAENLREWIDIWSEMEVLLSLSVVGHTRTVYTFPELRQGPPELTARRLSPLLIDEDKAVPNDADFTAGACIITGSNMSGKTTYLRALASSAVLAYAGAPICAEFFALTPLHIFTSIQVNDDPSRGISTFYAELLRIRQMVLFSRRKAPMLICIDEIFKGTNSADRITGAKEALRRLIRPWCITLVTTHDFELCDLHSPNDLPVTNCHFEEFYEDGKIRFDYRRKPGRCRTTNARYLLRMAGILSDEETDAID